MLCILLLRCPFLDRRPSLVDKVLPVARNGPWVPRQKVGQEGGDDVDTAGPPFLVHVQPVAPPLLLARSVGGHISRRHPVEQRSTRADLCATEETDTDASSLKAKALPPMCRTAVGSETARLGTTASGRGLVADALHRTILNRPPRAFALFPLRRRMVPRHVDFCQEALREVLRLGSSEYAKKSARAKRGRECGACDPGPSDCADAAPAPARRKRTRRPKAELDEEKRELFGQVVDLRAAGVAQKHRFAWRFTTDGAARDGYGGRVLSYLESSRTGAELLRRLCDGAMARAACSARSGDTVVDFVARWEERLALPAWPADGRALAEVVHAVFYAVQRAAAEGGAARQILLLRNYSTDFHRANKRGIALASELQSPGSAQPPPPAAHTPSIGITALPSTFAARLATARLPGGSERRLRAHRRSLSGLTTRDLTCTICTEHGCIHTSGDGLLGCVIITSCGHPLHAVCAFEYVRHEYERRMLDHLPPLLDDLLGVPWANAWRTISCTEKAARVGLLFAPCPACRKEHAFAHFFAVCKHAPPSP
ncbi:hypothetical protein AB1Y20_007140 [Prymnesium parvum]|uniref:RING-type domain-containing protein n=1 Tax=Prymnesium parvum TaxID=97485 RepID=A0AB34IWH1_PRYPA